MSMQRSPRLDRDTAEHLVAGHGVGPVASVLRAAAAPAYRDELAGEETVAAAFLAAATTAPRRRSAFRTVLAKVLTVKAVIVMAIAGSTGIVLAASEGALPVPWSNSPVGPPATTTTTPPAQHTPGSRTTDHRQPPAAPDPSIAGLCQAYTADDGKNLDNPAFRELAAAAGGKDEIDGYCATVEHPGPSSPAGKPDEAEPDHQPGAPSDVPGPGDQSKAPEVPRTSAAGPPAEQTRPSKPGKTNRPTETTEAATTTETPGSTAPGAATAVPPSGAEPPSEGG